VFAGNYFWAAGEFIFGRREKIFSPPLKLFLAGGIFSGYKVFYGFAMRNVPLAGFLRTFHETSLHCE
jgi:hypothetical protein